MTYVVKKWFPRIEVREGGKAQAYKEGRNGQNNLLRVWVYNGIEFPSAVAAQELYEHEFKVNWGLRFGLVAATLCALLGTFVSGVFFIALVPVVAAAMLLLPVIKPMRRKMEIFSHEAETQWAMLYYSQDSAAYRKLEIGNPNRKQGGMVTYSHLKGMSVSQIEQAMRNVSPQARRWVVSPDNATVLKEIARITDNVRNRE